MCFGVVQIRSPFPPVTGQNIKPQIVCGRGMASQMPPLKCLKGSNSAARVFWIRSFGSWCSFTSLLAQPEEKKEKKNKDEKFLRFVLVCTEFLWELQVSSPTPSRSHLEAVEQAQALSVGPDEVWTTTAEW